MACYSIIYAIAFVCLFNICATTAYNYENYDSRSVRNTRLRSNSRVPVELQDELEDSYGDIITSRPQYIEGGNSWKPLFLSPPSRSVQKYFSKQNHPQKYQHQNIESYSKNHHRQQYSLADIIANQSLLVTDSLSAKPSQKKSKYVQVHSKKHQPQPQFQVHEDLEDTDTDSYYAQQSQNRFKQEDVIIGKPKSLLHYRQQPALKEKHIHHLHYHNNDEETPEVTNDNNYRYKINKERRPERKPESRPYIRNSRYSPSYSSSRRPY